MAVGGKVDAGIASTSEKACADQPSTAPNVWGGGHVMEWAGRDGVRSAAKELSKVLFYPTVLYNVVRSKLQSTWHYSDAINEHVIIGALPFVSHLDDFVAEGIKAVVTLNQEFEVFVSPQKYKELGIAHLHIPTTDYLFAPTHEEITRGTQFIRDHELRGEKTYVHCKAGRGRSTTLVLCYLVKFHGMNPSQALDHVRSRRPQVCLAQGQWDAVWKFYSTCRGEG